MITLICPSGDQFNLTEVEVRRLKDSKVEGVYRFINSALCTRSKEARRGGRDRGRAHDTGRPV